MVKYLFMFCMAICMVATAQDYSEFGALVVGVHDGDTYTIVVNNVKQSLRMAGIDTPELAQAFGKNSRDSVAKYIVNKKVVVRTAKNGKLDMYGRMLGVVVVGGVFMDSLMVARGWAWHYKEYPVKYGKSDRILEQIAKEKHLGLWSCRVAIPPKLFRLFNAQTKKLYGNCE